ncbi:MAG: alpha/beta hydrolase [Tepidisphaeraceae bacterium]
MSLYVVLPVAAVGAAILWRQRGRTGQPVSVSSRLASLAVTFLAGLGVAVAMCLIYARVAQGHVPLRQIFVAAYFATALLLLLRLFDGLLLWSLRRLLGVHRPGAPTFARGLRVFAALLTRSVLLIAFGLPFVTAAMMVYRPKIQPSEDPRTKLGAAFDRVEFTASDGMKLVGWWMPVPPDTMPDTMRGSPRAASPTIITDPQRGRRTVILCHGLLTDKSRQLALAGKLAAAGFNVLTFDFRGYGESAGQLTGYGALEKRDVLAAVRWVRANRPAQAEKIFGVGESIGAVAMISAAADPSPDGQAIDAVAAVGGYDDLHLLASEITAAYFRPSLGWLIEQISLPVAALHAGVDLTHYHPAGDLPAIWPRPVLFIHGQQDALIPFERGRSLRDAAVQPRYHFWFPQGSHDDIANRAASAHILIEFFRHADPFPVI